MVIAVSVLKSFLPPSKFEILLPFILINIYNSRSHILQADSAEMLNMWISALQRSIGAAIQHDSLQSRPQSSLNANPLNIKKKM